MIASRAELEQLTAEAEEVQAEIERRREAAEAKRRANLWCPQTPTPKQAEFLALDCKEAFYGGAAGGGKSSTLLMGGLAHVDVPGYAALILRRTYKDLSQPKSIMDRAAEWLRPTGATWNDRDKTWWFPQTAGPRARLVFGHLEDKNAHFNYQGAELDYIGVDELTQIPEYQYTYLLSRLRRLLTSPVRPIARSAGNPGGIGHDWVHARFVNPKTRGARRFVPALLSDNPFINEAEYREMLAELDDTTRRQLEHGEWIRNRGGLLYRYADVRNGVVELPPTHFWNFRLGVDLGASQITPTSALVELADADTCKEAYITRSKKFIAADVTALAEAIKAWDAERGYEVTVVDAGGLGGLFLNEFRNRFSIACREAQKANKLGFRKLMNGAFERGQLLVVKGQNEGLIEEMGSLEWNEDGDDCKPGQPDHLTDAELYVYRESRAYSAEVPSPGPVPGTPEHAAAVERELLRQDDEQLGADGATAWWERDS